MTALAQRALSGADSVKEQSEASAEDSCYENDPLRAAKGTMTGILVSLVIWGGIAAVYLYI